MSRDEGFQIAVEEARLGMQEGGIPIGACLVSAGGKILGRGRNMRVQEDSPILHGEISALQDAGRHPASAYYGATMYTTLSPCDMCTGACILYKIKRVVVGENRSFMGGEEYLKRRGIEVVVLHDSECYDMMQRFINQQPEICKAEPWGDSL